MNLRCFVWLASTAKPACLAVGLLWGDSAIPHGRWPHPALQSAVHHSLSRLSRLRQKSHTGRSRISEN